MAAEVLSFCKLDQVSQCKPYSHWEGTYGNADLLLVVNSIASLALGLEDADDLLVLPSHLVRKAGEGAELQHRMR